MKDFVPETPPHRSLAGPGKGACNRVARCEDVHRFVWIKAHARGRVLDVGGNEGSGWFMPMPDGTPLLRRVVALKDGRPAVLELPARIADITILDCDKWLGAFPLVRGDAHRLPFRDRAFDTVNLGDILEHVRDDYAVLWEALRVARWQVIGTTPDEYGWDPELNPFKPIEEWVRERGDLKTLMHEETRGLKTDYATCLDYMDEPTHLHHVRWYDYEKITRLLSSTGRPYELEHIHYHDGKFTNFAFTIESEP